MKIEATKTAMIHGNSRYGSDPVWAEEVYPRLQRSVALLQEGRRRGEPIYIHNIKPPSHDEITLVRDWLYGLDSFWLEKLPRITWCQAVEHARKWHEQLAKQKAVVAGTDGTDSRIESVDGCYWVRLTTEKAMDRESVAMGNCVGHGRYDYYLDDLDDLRSGIFSLRDADGQSIITAEISTGEVEQIQRRENTPVIAADAPHLGALSTALEMKAGTWKSRQMLRDARTGYIYPMDEMPAGMVVQSDLLWHSFRGPLPEGWHVAGNLSFSERASPAVLPLPAGLTVDGDLTVPESYLPLRDDITVKGKVLQPEDRSFVRGLHEVDLKPGRGEIWLGADLLGEIEDFEIDRRAEPATVVRQAIQLHGTVTMTLQEVSPEFRALMTLGVDTQRLRSRTSPVTPMRGTTARPDGAGRAGP